MCEIYLDDEYCELWKETKRKARKSHKCNACRGRIAPGDRYYTHFSKFDGDITSCKMCLECHAVREDFAAAHDSLYPNPGHFPVLLQECINEGPEELKRWGPSMDAMKVRAAESVTAGRGG